MGASPFARDDLRALMIRSSKTEMIMIRRRQLTCQQFEVIRLLFATTTSAFVEGIGWVRRLDVVRSPRLADLLYWELNSR